MAIGKNTKVGHDDNDAADGAYDKDIAIDRAARGDSLGEQEQESRGDDERAVAHAELAVAQLSEQGVQPVEGKAADADTEALGNEPAESRRPRQG